MGGSFQDHLEDLFAPLGGVAIRKMFGGLGVFKDGLMLGLVDSDALYLKVDDQTQAAFEAEASGPFMYSSRGRQMQMAYWRLPERLYDEPEEFRDWAMTAFAVAERTKKPKRSRKT